ncbi:MAG: alginate export family protein, partial [Pseudomonadota bacterium]
MVGTSKTCVLGAIALGVAQLACADEPVRLNGILNLSDNLTVYGAYRVRIEGVNGRFRSGFDGTDQILVERLVLAAEYDFGGIYVGAELQDSRQQLADEGTPIGTDDVNPAELLQGYIGYRTENAFLQGDAFDIKAGRMTLNIAPRRLSARNGFRNTINSFNGVRADWTAPNGDELLAFYTLPVRRQPSDRESLLNNEVVFDRESIHQRF